MPSNKIDLPRPGQSAASARAEGISVADSVPGDAIYVPTILEVVDGSEWENEETGEIGIRVRAGGRWV